MPFQPHVTGLSAAKATDESCHVVGQDRLQPMRQLAFRGTTELPQMSVGLAERFLHQVRCIGLGLESPSDLNPRQQRQVTAVELQQSALGVAHSRPYLG